MVVVAKILQRKTMFRRAFPKAGAARNGKRGNGNEFKDCFYILHDLSNKLRVIVADISRFENGERYVREKEKTERVNQSRFFSLFSAFLTHLLFVKLQ